MRAYPRELTRDGNRTPEGRAQEWFMKFGRRYALALDDAALFARFVANGDRDAVTEYVKKHGLRPELAHYDLEC